MANNRTRRAKNKRRRKLNRALRYTKRNKAILANAKKCVQNFSDYTLSDSETIILSKGMKFIPSRYIKRLKQNLIRDFDSLSRRMRLSYELSDGSQYKPHPFYVHSNYQPQLASNAIENYIFNTKIELGDFKLSKVNNNLSKSEMLMLTNLKNNKQITIKVADKSKTIVVQNTTNYINEGLRQLNQIYYEKIDKPSTDEAIQILKEIIKQLTDQGLIDDMTRKFVSQNIEQPKIGKIYFLPKLHKLPIEALEGNKTDIIIPSRPIVSQCGSYTENIGRLADYFLLPVVQKQPTYLKDTTDFINKLESIKCTSDVLLVSYDISSMYTNMKIPELLNAVQNACTEAENINYDIPFIGTQAMISILKVVLERNEFEFAGQYYRQIIGCSMGAVPSPEISDLRAYEIINNILSKFPTRNNILTHFRYRDDGFILYKGKQQEVDYLFQLANEEHELIKFTYVTSGEEINFLDTLVFKGDRFLSSGILDIRTYHKPTETFCYIHRSSSHNDKVFNGLIKGEITRHIRINSDTNFLLQEIELFKSNLMNRGYKSKVVDEIIRNTLKIKRNDALKYGNKKDKNKIPLVLATKYHHGIRQLSKVIKKHWHLIAANAEAKRAFPRPPMIAFKRDKNLGDYLMSAKVQL